jgi:starvation-inducible outer membrane lipoprotein
MGGGVGRVMDMVLGAVASTLSGCSSIPYRMMGAFPSSADELEVIPKNAMLMRKISMVRTSKTLGNFTGGSSSCRFRFT